MDATNGVAKPRPSSIWRKRKEEEEGREGGEKRNQPADSCDFLAQKKGEGREGEQEKLIGQPATTTPDPLLYFRGGEGEKGRGEKMVEWEARVGVPDAV